jgi:L-ascorbate metabolism protein UlaG (beta-lactamase superfamily)
VSDHHDGKRFFNPWGANNSKSLLDVMKWKLSSVPRPWPEPPVANTARPRVVRPGEASSLHVTYVGHATVLLQDSALTVLTDPHLGARASPVGFAGPERFRAPGVALDELPSLHYVVISHNHYDHLDLPTLVRLDARFHPRFVVPLGNAKLLRDEGIADVVELDWWESIGPVRLVPAQHWSARGLDDRNEALWGGYVIELSGRKVFFAGDTGYGPHFRWIRERCGDMDVSLLPIGAYEPRWFMKDQHMNPADAVLAHLDLGSRQSFAIHFETFRLTDEGFGEPRLELRRQLEARELPLASFVAPEVGETLVLP